MASADLWVENICRAWEQADWIDHWLGEKWYADAHAAALALTPHDVRVGAGVIAALSPRETWTRNLRSAERLIRTGVTGGMSRSLNQAQRIIDGEPAETVLGGPKTRAFYLCIVAAGRCAEVVIDMHAWNITQGALSRGEDVSRGDNYELAASAYREAARRLSGAHGPLWPSQVQATTWVWQRREVHGASSRLELRAPRRERPLPSRCPGPVHRDITAGQGAFDLTGNGLDSSPKSAGLAPDWT